MIKKHASQYPIIKPKPVCPNCKNYSEFGADLKNALTCLKCGKTYRDKFDLYNSVCNTLVEIATEHAALKRKFEKVLTP